MSSILEHNVLQYKYMNKSFAKNLRELRKENALRQSDLAKAVGVSARTVSFWESGERECDFNTLIKIAQFFKVSTDFLLGISEF